MRCEGDEDKCVSASLLSRHDCDHQGASGSLKFTFATGGAVRSSVAIGSHGTIYVGSEDGSVYAIGD